MRSLIIPIIFIFMIGGCATYQEVDEYYSESHMGQYDGIEPADIEAVTLILITLIIITGGI